MAKLGITRSAVELAQMMHETVPPGIKIIPLELTQTNPLLFELPVEEYLRGLDWALFTSARGVRTFLRRLEDSDMTLAKKTKIAVVGEKTALALSQFGLSAAFTPQEISSEGLFREFLLAYENISAVALYISANKPNFNPETLFASSSINLSRLPVYETIPANCPPSSGTDFDRDDYILFTAPSTVSAYQSFFGAPRAAAITLSKTTAMKISEQGWPAPIIMAKPDINTVFAYLEQPQEQRRRI